MGPSNSSYLANIAMFHFNDFGRKSNIPYLKNRLWWTPISFIPVVPGQAGGGSFQKEKNYITQKELNSVHGHWGFGFCKWGLTFGWKIAILKFDCQK